MLLLRVKSELNGLVTIGLDGLALNHRIRAGQHDRDGNSVALRIVNARLAEFLSEQA